jgi:hypothetical protein
MPKPIHNLRWWPAELVFLSMVINHIDRQTPAALSPRLTRELDFSGIQYGWISHAFIKGAASPVLKLQEHTR